MKTILTSIFVAFITTLWAMPSAIDTLHEGTKIQPTTTKSKVISVEKLQQENLRLQNQINGLENEKSELQFNYIMSKMLYKISEEEKTDKISDLNAELNFGKIVSQTLLILKEKSTW